MPDKIANIAKNTSYYTFALILQKVISFSYFTILARALGPEDLGKYYFAISFTAIFAIFIDLGLANVLIREIAKARDRAAELLANILAIKIPLALLSLIAVVIVIRLLGYPELVRQLVYYSSISMVLDSFSLTFFAFIRGFHKLLYESVAAVIFQLVILIFGLTALNLGLGLRWLILALVAASTVNFAYLLSLLLLKWKLTIRPSFNKKIISTIIKITVPFALFAVCQRIYMYLDTVLLSILAGDKSVGLYQVAFKIVFALQFLPMAFTASLYPAFAAYWSNNRQQLAVTFERAMNYLIIIALPISLGVIALADKIILLFKSDFTEAILPLRIIMLALLFIFLNFPVGSILNACDRQKINTINMGLATLASITLNLILIPRLAALGACITVVAANLLMFILGLRQVPQIANYRPKIIIKVFFKSLAAGAVMFLLVIYFKSLINLWALTAIAAAVYFLALFGLGGFKKEDVVSIWSSFIKKPI